MNDRSGIEKKVKRSPYNGVHPRFNESPIKWVKYKFIERPFRRETARRLLRYKNKKGEYPTHLKIITHAFVKGALFPKDQDYYEKKDNVPKAQYTADNASYCFLATTALETLAPYAITHAVNYFFPGANFDLSETFNLVEIAQYIHPVIGNLVEGLHFSDVFKYMFELGVVINGTRFIAAKKYKKRSCGIGFIAAGIITGHQIKKSHDRKKN